ncbi:MAG: hypothetical protein E7169_01500 [Firmicutes bacterium]|nr:hypothetical protein [Bacillota bacterium]
MKSVKGQALVEFVIIIPIFFIILFSAIDLGNIIYKKYQMENDLDYVVDLYRQNKTSEINVYVNKQGLILKTEKIEETVKISLEKTVKINTPGMNIIINNPYKIVVDRVVYDE